MRLGVLDVGSNTVHLAIVDGHGGGAPVPAYKEKTELRLAELVDERECVTDAGAAALVAAVRSARAAAERLGAEDLLAFATSAVREARNTDEVLDRVAAEAGVRLEVLTGEDEARLTFLAVRRWFGWSAGRLLVLDIGGGSLEVAVGVDEQPELSRSVPLGAGRVTRELLPGDPPKRGAVAEVRGYARAHLRPLARDLARVGAVDLAVGTSKTLRQVARIAGAAPSSAGPRVRRAVSARQLAAVAARITPMTVAERAGLPGVSPGRARQLAAGAVVAEVALAELGVEELVVCPWALREGVILRRLDRLGGGG